MGQKTIFEQKQNALIAFVTRVKKSYNSKESLKKVLRKDAILCFRFEGFKGVDALCDAILQSPLTESTAAESTQLELSSCYNYP